MKIGFKLKNFRIFMKIGPKLTDFRQKMFDQLKKFFEFCEARALQVKARWNNYKNVHNETV